ncbi:MAG: hypothetical protein WDO12_13735 [Pseudomonadota bacterium]
MKFPANYGAAELAGKDAEFDLTVKSVEEPVLPAVDETFAQSFGIGDGSLSALRAEVQKSMERESADCRAQQGCARRCSRRWRATTSSTCRSPWVDEQIQQLQYDLLQRMGRSDVSQLPPRDPFVEPAQRPREAGPADR